MLFSCISQFVHFYEISENYIPCCALFDKCLMQQRSTTKQFCPCCAVQTQKEVTCGQGTRLVFSRKLPAPISFCEISQTLGLVRSVTHRLAFLGAVKLQL